MNNTENTNMNNNDITSYKNIEKKNKKIKPRKSIIIFYFKKNKKTIKKVKIMK